MNTRVPHCRVQPQDSTYVMGLRMTASYFGVQSVCLCHVGASCV